MVEFFELERLDRHSSVNFVRLDSLRNGREVFFVLSESRRSGCWVRLHL